MNRLWLLAILGLGLLIIFGNWNRLFGEHDVPQPTTDHVAEERPDYSLEEISLREFGSDGHLNHKVSAQRIDHYAADDRLELQRPVVTAYEGQKALLEISSDSAISHNHPAVVLMQGATQVVQHQAPFLRIDTRNLFIYPDSAVVESQLATRIQARGLDLHCGSFIYRYGKGELRLSEGVEGKMEQEHGQTRFLGQTLVFQYQQEQPQSLLIQGSPAQVEYHNSTQPMQGRAQKIYYDFTTQILTLEGDAYVKQGGQEFHGDTLRFDMKQNRMVMSGGEQGEAQPPVKFIIQEQPQRTEP